MTNTEKEAPVKLGGMQAHTRDLFNKGIGSEGTCSTAAATAAKEVTLGTTFELVNKATILVKFTNAISVASATLAVTHTDLDGTTTTETAKPIYYRGAALAANMVKAGDILVLRYDGTSWNIIGVLDQDLSGKQDVINDLSDIRSGATAGASAYQLPSGGVPKTDLASGVQSSLDKADSALQSHQDISGKADKSETVSDVIYDSSTGKLKKTINGTTTNVCDVVTSGFGIQYNSQTGIKTLTPVGGATGAFNDNTGIKAITF